MIEYEVGSWGKRGGGGVAGKQNAFASKLPETRRRDQSVATWTPTICIRRPVHSRFPCSTWPTSWTWNFMDDIRAVLLIRIYQHVSLSLLDGNQNETIFKLITIDLG